MSTLLIFILLVGAVLTWAELLRVNEQVLQLSKRVCGQLRVQLLEGSVICTGLRWTRDVDGRWRLLRRFEFEFSVDGNDRRHGEVQVWAGRVRQINLDHPDGPILETFG